MIPENKRETGQRLPSDRGWKHTSRPTPQQTVVSNNVHETYQKPLSGSAKKEVKGEKGKEMDAEYAEYNLE